MDHEKARLLKIANEIAFYCYNLGADNMNINILNKEDYYEISLKCDIDNLPKNELEKLQQDLDVPRRHEVEEYLYELAGESQGFRELSLVGMMIDKVKIAYENRQFMITLYRNNEDQEGSTNKL
ncbi:hypothetical protein [Alkaliphilus transvaalensis]|uniref:hypothetical protein n=1 Tax=Alkaliphilus transvaalensis TaxID=114628 RepID=UPI0012EC78F1|nr:hypothetical protein [Alkaliphilus transvaalensis]